MNPLRVLLPVLVFIGLVTASLAQIDNSSVVPAAPQTTSIADLLKRLDDLSASQANTLQAVNEMRTQFDDKQERVRQSDQLFYLFYEPAVVCLVAFVFLLWNKVTEGRRRKSNLVFQDAILEKQEQIAKNMVGLNARIDALSIRFLEIEGRVKISDPKPLEVVNKRPWWYIENPFKKK